MCTAGARAGGSSLAETGKRIPRGKGKPRSRSSHKKDLPPIVIGGRVSLGLLGTWVTGRPDIIINAGDPATNLRIFMELL
jgi:hypothetical protein